MPNGVWAVVVARISHGAKSRLAPVLDEVERGRLALAMLSDVLHVLHQSPLLDGVISVVDDPAGRDRASQLGAVVVDDRRADDMNAAVALGLAVARKHAARTAIVLPGDVPNITRADLATLLEAAEPAERAVIVGASRDGLGTNALLLRPLNVIQPAFGPPSVERHRRLGLAAGARTRVVVDLGLALDVDTPADLAELRKGWLAAT